MNIACTAFAGVPCAGSPGYGKGNALKHKRKQIGTVPLCQTCQGYATAAKGNKSSRVPGPVENGIPPESHRRDLAATGVAIATRPAAGCSARENSFGWINRRQVIHRGAWKSSSRHRKVDAVTMLHPHNVVRREAPGLWRTVKYTLNLSS